MCFLVVQNYLSYEALKMDKIKKMMYNIVIFIDNCS